MNIQGIFKFYFDHLNDIMVLNDKVHSINVKWLWCTEDPSTQHLIHVTFESPFKTYYYLVWFLEMSKIIVIFLHDHDTRRHEIAKHAKMMFEDNYNSMTINVNKKVQRIAIYFEYGHEMQVLLPLGQMIRHRNIMLC
jgi:hypothetical protein